METKSNHIIADASALFSLAIDTDSNHERAVKVAQKLANSHIVIIIPAEIFAETINVIGKKFGHKLAVEAANDLFDSSIFLVTDTQEASRLNALDLFTTLPKDVSFTDCLVMAVADEYETKEIFGFDEIFQAKGYKLPGK